MEPWENDLRKAFADFQPEVNEDHWNAVMAKRRPSRRTALPLSWRVAASAALLLAVVWMIRWGAPDKEATQSDTAQRNTEAHSSPVSNASAEKQRAMAQGIRKETTDPVSTKVERPSDGNVGTPIPSPVAEATHEFAITAQVPVPLIEEPAVIPASLPIPGKLEQRGNTVSTVARIILPVIQDQPQGPVSTPFWKRLRRLPLFGPSEGTLPERTAETWAILQPEGLHRLQDMARRPTTIEIIW